jgi:hypothetical protein
MTKKAELTPSEIYFKKVYKASRLFSMKVYIDHRPHFKILGVMFVPSGIKCASRRVVTDYTLHFANTLGLKLTKDQEWIIRKDEDSLNASLTRLMDRQVRMDRIY